MGALALTAQGPHAGTTIDQDQLGPPYVGEVTQVLGELVLSRASRGEIAGHQPRLGGGLEIRTGPLRLHVRERVPKLIPTTEANRSTTRVLTSRSETSITNVSVHMGV